MVGMLVASSTLLVSGIGIMNIMLATVSLAHSRDRDSQSHRR